MTFDLGLEGFFQGEKEWEEYSRLRNSMSKGIEAEKGRYVYGPTNLFKVLEHRRCQEGELVTEERNIEARL